MQNRWEKFLTVMGASLAEDGAAHFGDPFQEVQAAINGTVLVALSHLSLVRVKGPDAQAFLHSQLSSDILNLDEQHSQLGSYCNPKGRMLALPRIFRRQDEFFLLIPVALGEETMKRLHMFILRAKISLDRVDPALVAFGIAGPNAGARLLNVIESVPNDINGVCSHGATTVLKLPGPTPRFMIVAPTEIAEQLWRSLHVDTTVVGSSVWDWFDIQAGLPTVLPATHEAFVPQMTNLELLGGISFTKGCYPGQEIVARMHYLGRLKQRMYLAHTEALPAPVAGDAIYAPNLEQSTGTVAQVAPAPEGGYDLLAIIHISSADTGALFLRSNDGPRLSLRSLPYSLTASDTKG